LYGPSANVVVTAVVSTKDLVINPSSSNYADKVYTATTDASGMYSITVDANQKVVNVTLKAQDFYKDYTDKRDTTTLNDKKEEVKSVYEIPYKNLVFKSATTVNSATQTVNAGETKLVDFLFTPNKETIKMVK